MSQEYIKMPTKFNKNIIALITVFILIAIATITIKAFSTKSIELSSAGGQKIKVIKIVRELTGLGLKEAVDAVNSAPTILKKGVSREEEEKFRTELEAVGAKITIK